MTTFLSRSPSLAAPSKTRVSGTESGRFLRLKIKNGTRLAVAQTRARLCAFSVREKPTAESERSCKAFSGPPRPQCVCGALSRGYARRARRSWILCTAALDSRFSRRSRPTIKRAGFAIVSSARYRSKRSPRRPCRSRTSGDDETVVAENVSPRNILYGFYLGDSRARGTFIQFPLEDAHFCQVCLLRLHSCSGVRTFAIYFAGDRLVRSCAPLFTRTVCETSRKCALKDPAVSDWAIVIPGAAASDGLASRRDA